MNLSVIGDNDTLAGFALTGIKDLHFAESPEEAWQVYQKIENEIILIPENIIKTIETNKNDQKLLVRLSTSESQDLGPLIKNALGFDIKLNN